MGDLKWYQSETSETGAEAERAGYVASVEPTDGEDVPGWFWRVEATSAVSEWPETFAAGFAESLEAGKRLAEAALNRATARRAKRRAEIEPGGPYDGLAIK